MQNVKKQSVTKSVSCPQKNELSDVNKTYIDISNGQKFELLVRRMLEPWRLKDFGLVFHIFNLVQMHLLKVEN